jgi:hypothetical protein
MTAYPPSTSSAPIEDAVKKIKHSVIGNPAAKSKAAQDGSIPLYDPLLSIPSFVSNIPQRRHFIGP